MTVPICMKDQPGLPPSPLFLAAPEKPIQSLTSHMTKKEQVISGSKCTTMRTLFHTAKLTTI